MSLSSIFSNNEKKIHQCVICLVEKFHLNFYASSGICNNKGQFNYVEFLRKEVPGNSKNLLDHFYGSIYFLLKLMIKIFMFMHVLKTFAIVS